MSTTWTSPRQINTEHQLTLESYARWSKKRRTRQERKEMKAIQSSWTNAVSTLGHFFYQCMSHTRSTFLVFMYMLWYSFFKRVFEDWVSFPGWRPSPPLAYVDNATLRSLIWFPFWQIRGYPSFLFVPYFSQ